MKKNHLIVLLIFLIFFVISFLTNILGPLIPDIIDGFHLNLTLAAFLPFSFFAAYGVMSIPSGMLVDRYKEKRVMLIAFILAFAGALIFALFPGFTVAMFSLFIIGSGMAMLQVAINPLLRIAGGEAHFAFNSVMAQLVFGSASFLSPQVYTYLVTNLHDINPSSNVVIKTLSGVVPQALPWVSLYWVFTLVTLLMVILMSVVKLPVVVLKDDEKAGAWQTHKELFKNKTVVLYFFGIFAYVGSEQGVANWISKFLSTYHGLIPQTAGADAVAYFWGLLTIGCLLGLVLLTAEKYSSVFLLQQYSA